MWNTLHSPFRRFLKNKDRSRRELENQIAELQKQNEILQSLLSYHTEEEEEKEE